ncbi:MAG: thiolase family protein [Halanaerobiales bacterium]|nr:thiolase family protein [Halanaerobiales bacterium]
MLENAYIPYKGYYSTPFCKWMKDFQAINSIKLGGQTSKNWFEEKEIDKSLLNYMYLGLTIGQERAFFGATLAANEMDLRIPGQTIMHACATSTTTIYNASLAVDNGDLDVTYCLLVDRCSNSPHTVWPNPNGPGGKVESEDWFMDNLTDPATGEGTLATAERVARENNFSKKEADELSVIRYQQYTDALKNDREFQKRFMFPVKIKKRKNTNTIDKDIGIRETTKEGLSKLDPIVKGGVHTFGGQTHPADGNAGVIVANKEKAAMLSKDKTIPIKIIAYGCTRTEKKGYMPVAASDAAKIALDKADLTVDQIRTIKAHNPFVVNDLYLAKDLGVDKEQFNNYGSSLIYGHPQGPTLARLLIEGIEETVILGGGYILITGCVGGDTGAALVLKVG